jgi:hypothetical protein
MFIAMNRFKVIKEECKAFEDVWLTRDSRLGEVKGFVAFHLLRGPEREDHVLYFAHDVGDARRFQRLDQIRAVPRRPPAGRRAQAAHARAPDFEGFEVIQTI